MPPTASAPLSAASLAALPSFPCCVQLARSVICATIWSVVPRRETENRAATEVTKLLHWLALDPTLRNCRQALTISFGSVILSSLFSLVLAALTGHASLRSILVQGI